MTRQPTFEAGYRRKLQMNLCGCSGELQIYRDNSRREAQEEKVQMKALWYSN